MAWNPPERSECKPDEEILEELDNLPIVPRSTGFHMFQIVAKGKQPVLAGVLEKASADLEELSPAQARYAFRQGWVPDRLFTQMKLIALSDGKADLPDDEE